MFVCKSLRGSMVIELLISMLILAIIGTPTFHFFKTHYMALQKTMRDQQNNIELLNAYIQINSDLNGVVSIDDSTCCVTTNTHSICYDINNQRFRRRKKSHSATRFYTIYIGNVEQWQQLECRQNNDVFTVSYTANDTTSDWVFYANQVD